MIDKVKLFPIEHEVKIYVSQLFSGDELPIIVLAAKCVHCGSVLNHGNDPRELPLRHDPSCKIAVSWFDALDDTA